MNIAEIFYSIQGEGNFLGFPSIFIRTSGCNLRCEWCDTPYTSWHPEKNQMSIDEIVNYVVKLTPSTFLPHIVITGGEPYLQNDLPELITHLKKSGYFITVETNGTIYLPTQADFLSISPKLFSSSPSSKKWKIIHEEKRININVLRLLISSSDFQLKFVIDRLEDFEEVDSILKHLGKKYISPKDVVLMPQGQKSSELKEKYLMLIEKCLTKGYRITPRFHVDIWGSERGR